MPNHLADAISPYLLQHADNPVDWHEWGDQAFAEARRRDVPILLSVGYAACHWCHVMAHESFADEGIAALINRHFVPIKVDREERPDIDSVYMQATIAMTGQGGWPMTCFLDTDGNPFFCGTYFPNPRFAQVLEAVHQAWTNKRDDILASARDIRAHLQRAAPARGDARIEPDALANAVDRLEQSFDAEYGGFGDAPKFPPSMVMEFLLRHHARTGAQTAMSMVEQTLTAMAHGGIHDQLGGGFARYSVDRAWAVPHFEKMLYDNALLLRAYLHWYRVSGSELARHVVEETVGFLLRDLATDEGGFASSLDADTDGAEGATYVWTPAQLTAVLGPDDGARAARFLGVDERGNFADGTSTLRQTDAAPAAWPAWRSRLFAQRQQRPQPARDDKVVTSWNGLALGALAEAGALLGETTWITAATTCATLIWTTHVQTQGTDIRLLRASRQGRVGNAVGMADDYGNLAAGLLALHQAGGEACWLDRAGQLLRTALTLFAAPDGGFHDAPASTEPLPMRARNISDNAEPSGTSALADALLTYAALTGDLRQAADAATRSMMATAAIDPRFAGSALATAEAILAGPLEVAVVGTDATATAMAQAARQATSPGLVLVCGPGTDPAHAVHPLLRDRPLLAGKSTAYVCRGFVCGPPVTSVAALRGALA